MDDLGACRRQLRVGSRSFYAASLILPREVRHHATALYAFCRVADDAVDCADATEDAVVRLRGRLARLYAGAPDDHPADRAFAETAARFGIPRAIPEALLEGFAWDAAGRRYENISDLTAYAARVAGAVGVMMALVMGASDEAALARACDLGVAMQLSNIARDVGEDARAGRIYLPLTWFREAGIDPDAWLAEPRFSPVIGAFVARLLAIADRHYASAEAGIPSLPAGCRPGIRAARLIYAEIGRRVAANGFDSISSRAVVPIWRKLSLLARSFVAPANPSMVAAQPALPETRFLVEAAARRAIRPAPPPRIAWWNLDARIDALVALFARLERADDFSRGRS